MLRQIEWWVQNEQITKNGSLPVTALFFWKFCFGLRTSYKELIWCSNDPNDHVRSFCKCWSFMWRCFFPVSILNFSNMVPCSPFSQGKVGQWCCLFENELLSKIFVCWRSKVLILLLSVPIYLCVTTTVPPLTIGPQLISVDILYPIPFWMHLVCISTWLWDRIK